VRAIRQARGVEDHGAVARTRDALEDGGGLGIWHHRAARWRELGV
jgi:hypothetical protein